MAKLQDLKLRPETGVEEVDFDQAPEQFGAGAPPPPEPGTYRFRLPKDLSAIWAAIESEGRDFISAVFDAQHALVIVGGPLDKHPFQTRLNNLPRARGKERLPVSDLAYLLKALKEEHVPKGNVPYAEAVMKHGGAQFYADIEWNWNCAKGRDIYVDDGQGGSIPVVGQKGCGSRYYMGGKQGIQRQADGKYPLRIVCGNPECGALIRAFAQLSNFHPVE